MWTGTEVEVLYDYKAERTDELTILPGDRITNVKKMDGGWWEGELHGQRGLFPDNFVQIIEKKEAKEPKPSYDPKRETGGSTKVSTLAAQISQNMHIGQPPSMAKRENKKFFHVTYTYKSTREDELDLVPGMVVEFVKEYEPGWFEGVYNGKRGVFPSNFVTEAPPEENFGRPNEAPEQEHGDSAKKKVVGVGFGNIFAGQEINLKHTPGVAQLRADPNEGQESSGGYLLHAKQDPPGKVLEKACVLYEYKAENDDELDIVPGDIVTVLDKNVEDNGWWMGELRGRVGLFPDNFVDILVTAPPEQKEPNANWKSSSAPRLPASKPDPVPQQDAAKHNGMVPCYSSRYASRSHDNSLPPQETVDSAARSNSHPDGFQSLPRKQVDEVVERPEVKQVVHAGVPVERFEQLLEEVQKLKEHVEEIKRQHSKQIVDLMQEIDEEKKLRMASVVENERIKKLVANLGIS